MTISAHPLVVRARGLATDLLLPEAERVDQEGVPVSHIAAVKRSGLLGVVAPVEYGGAGAPPAVLRETAEIMAGACCSTWFVQTQHHTPVQTLAQSGAGPVRDRLLGPLSRGELLSGVAYAHLRSYPRVPVRVRRQDGGRRFDGTVPWYTGWGLNDVMLLAGVSEDDEVLFAFADAREQPGLRASPPMRLAALTASRTVSLELTGLWLPEEAVVLRTPYERWAPGDRARTLNANPAVFGVAEAALSLLPGDTAAPLRTRLADVRRRAYALADLPPAHERTGERLAVRTEAYEVLGTATTAAVVAGGGRAMALTSRAQRLAREALFLLVQGQTAESRAAHLRALTGGGADG